MAQRPAAANLDVELQNIIDAKAKLFEFKVLLLGAGESGKSTIVKQLKMIHTKGKKVEEDVNLVIDSLHQNVIDCVKALVLAVGNFGFQDKLTEDESETIRTVLDERTENERINPEEARLLLSLVEGKAVKKAYKKRNEFWILDSWPYYKQNLERFAQPDFSPTEEDMLMARIRTTGIVETKLEQKVIPTIPDEPEFISFTVVDVGGQRNERKKWMHCFDDVKCILFVVNLAGYNQVLFEDSSRNRMHEALELFEKVANNPLFLKTPMFLFLNKKDLFEEMIKETDLNVCFPDYTGGLNVIPALAHVKKEFENTLKINKKVHTINVIAALRKDVKAAFEEVKEKLYFSNKSELVGKLKAFKQTEDEIKRKIDKKDCCVIS